MYNVIIWKDNDNEDMHVFEKTKLKNTTYPNKRATKAWYAWQERTNRQCLPGDYISGTVAIVKKQKFKLKEVA
jgi:hypothetical protein